MPDKRISELSEATNPAATSEVPIREGASNFRVSLRNIVKSAITNSAPVDIGLGAIIKAYAVFNCEQDIFGDPSSANTDRRLLAQVGVTRVRRNASGYYTVTFSSAMSNQYYGIMLTPSRADSLRTTAHVEHSGITSSGFSFYFVKEDNTATNPNRATLMVFQ